jgi:excisionase family DNA binding protein
MQQLYSVEQVAGLLGLHVKTVRNYVRDGRLKAVRVGKQYRIARADLEAFTGQPVPEPARRTRHTEVSSIVQIDAIGVDSMNRLSTMIIASVNHPYEGEHVRVQTVYDEARASLKIILVGGIGPTVDLLKTIEALQEQL